MSLVLNIFIKKAINDSNWQQIRPNDAPNLHVDTNY